MQPKPQSTSNQVRAANAILMHARAYLKGDLAGKDFYSNIDSVISSHPAIKNWFFEEFIDLETYAATEMKTSGFLRSPNDPTLTGLVRAIEDEIAKQLRGEVK